MKKTTKRIIFLFISIIAVVSSIQAQNNTHEYLKKEAFKIETNGKDSVVLSSNDLEKEIEINSILKQNNLEFITVEVWTDKEKKISSRICTWDDDIFYDVLQQKRGTYFVFLKSSEYQLDFYKCRVGLPLSL